MSTTLFKAVLALTIVVCVLSQATTAPTNSRTGSKTFAQPDPSWSDYQVKSCCPQGFNQVGNYCAKCNAPNVFDPIDNTCKPCPSDHQYSNLTQRCECFAPCNAPRAINPANNQCECKNLNGTQMVYKTDTNECVCPLNLPLWNGKYCVACPTGTEFDPKERQCYHCPEGFIRDYNTHSCAPGL